MDANRRKPTKIKVVGSCLHSANPEQRANGGTDHVQPRLPPPERSNRGCAAEGEVRNDFGTVGGDGAARRYGHQVRARPVREGASRVPKVRPCGSDGSETETGGVGVRGGLGVAKSEHDLVEERKKKAMQSLLLDAPEAYIITAHRGKDGTWIREVLHGSNKLNEHLGTLEELTSGSMLSELSRINGGPQACWRHRMETNAPADSLAVGDGEEDDED